MSWKVPSAQLECIHAPMVCDGGLPVFLLICRYPLHIQALDVWTCAHAPCIYRLWDLVAQLRTLVACRTTGRAHGGAAVGSVRGATATKGKAVAIDRSGRPHWVDANHATLFPHSRFYLSASAGCDIPGVAVCHRVTSACDGSVAHDTRSQGVVRNFVCLSLTVVFRFATCTTHARSAALHRPTLIVAVVLHMGTSSGSTALKDS